MGPDEGRGGPLCRRRRTGHEPSPCFQGPRPCTPAPPATTALEVTRATQESLSPARSTPSWQQKGARVWQRACPALLATSAHPQVRMLSPQGRVARLRGSPRRQVSLPLLCPGLSSFEDHPCPPGHWCPGGQGAFLCPPGTFRTEPGASSREDCEHCPPGYYCPGAEQSGRPSVLAVPCGAGSECPAGGTAALSPPGPAPASHLSPELWPGGRGASQGTAWPPVWPREPSAQSPKARPGPQDPPSLVGSGPPGLRDRGPQPVPVSSGAVAEATCRAGSYCGPQTGVPPLCPGGYACPAGSSTYTGPGQL